MLADKTIKLALVGFLVGIGILLFLAHGCVTHELQDIGNAIKP